MELLIRKYKPGEEPALWTLFFETVRTINLGNYSAEQVRAWAPDDVDEAAWAQRIAEMNPYVCEHEGLIVGYAALRKSGYVDHFYVHHAWQDRGVGKRLYATIEADARAQQLEELTADVSITARPFFESRGFRVVRAQEVVRCGVVMRNFRMVKRLPVP
jgi:putative acetyltransferase